RRGPRSSEAPRREAALARQRSGGSPARQSCRHRSAPAPRSRRESRSVSSTMAPMYLDAMEFLEEEREAWRPYEALLELTDAQLDRPVDAVRGWSGRDLMVHLLAWLDIALAAAKELAVR